MLSWAGARTIRVLADWLKPARHQRHLQGFCRAKSNPWTWIQSELHFPHTIQMNPTEETEIYGIFPPMAFCPAQPFFGCQSCGISWTPKLWQTVIPSECAVSSNTKCFAEPIWLGQNKVLEEKQEIFVHYVFSILNELFWRLNFKKKGIFKKCEL